MNDVQLAAWPARAGLSKAQILTLNVGSAVVNQHGDVVGQVQARVRSPSQSGQRAAPPCPQCVPA